MQTPSEEKSLLTQLVDLLHTTLTLADDFFKMAILEAKLAGKSLVAIAVLCLFIFILIASTWICFLAAMCFYLFSLGWHGTCVFLLVGVLNLLLMLPIIAIILLYQKNLKFKATRRQLS